MTKTERARIYRERQRANGVCTSCSKAKTQRGTVCGLCREKARERAAMKRAEMAGGVNDG